ncbi:esterase [Mucilaginibacter corticis]|uniref:Esterase n=1 Tax=Mucilaginibacter corticis TaxID=2597670 RepID=A0A556MKU3_9SPHI|nr:alpha/beta hydrolase-fold protein [Mucilaginibacter corticis]TSJ40488.1 esterase [Mucilaginibacter corticis]
MNREYHKWYSGRLQRDMELLIFGHAGRAVLFFPTRMARFYDYENWGVIGALHDRIENGELQIFCVDSVDAESFYNGWVHPASRIYRHIQYEQYILHEVLPLMREKNPANDLEAAGCSMGAYHAANIAFKHPQLFNKVVCMSGRYDLGRQIHSFRDLFDGYHNEDIYFNMPQQYIANVHDDAQLQALRRLEITLAVGETDPFLISNQEFSQSLWDKSIPHQFYIWDNFAHKPRSWKKMVQLYL